jgi:uncharacterized protein (TIGR00251 family)
MTVSWARSVVINKDSGVELFLHCQPGAKKTEVKGVHGDRLKIRLAAPPLEGRANEALIAWLSKTLGVPTNRIELISGDTGRQKRVRITGIELAKVVQLDS